jgi:act minimal PKS acyl carrier protein
MATTEGFALSDLKRILLEGSGVSEGTDLEGDILDTSFEDLGYDSIAKLETVGRIEREYGITLDESIVLDCATPRAFVAAVRAHQLTASV